MIEKLLENWLDSASERSYQPVFVQMLVADGYRVVHSTRHCLLEYGKDILAIAPDGVGCAFQLKGDPKGRMRTSEFRRDILPQLAQLMGQKPAYPGFPEGAHRAYLVSNGQFEEEVQIAAGLMDGYRAKLSLWSRGDLLDLCIRHSKLLWPGELEDTRTLLELYLARPDDLLRIDLLESLLRSILEPPVALKDTEFARAVTSAAWLTGIVLSRFSDAQNSFAVIQGWVLCYGYLVAAIEKRDLSGGNFINTLELVEGQILDALLDMWSEIKERDHYVEGDPLVDSEILGWRANIMLAITAALALAQHVPGLLEPSDVAEIKAFMLNPPLKPELWGEGALAQLLPWLLWRRANEASARPSAELALLTSALIQRNQPNSSVPLASPYVSFDQLMTNGLGLEPGKQSQEEDFSGSSYNAVTMMHLCVRDGLKQHCKKMWAGFTKISHHSLFLENYSDYCLLRAEKGVAETRIYPRTYEWDILRSEALMPPSEGSLIPAHLSDRPWLLALWWQVAPHRCTDASVKIFVEKILPGWGR